MVDDDAPFRELAARILTGWGHTVVGAAATVEEALVRAAELEPDVALVDVGLPDGDGYTLTGQLRELPRPPQVVLTSSDSDGSTLPAALRAGASAFFPKAELAGASFRRLLERAGNP